MPGCVNSCSNGGESRYNAEFRRLESEYWQLARDLDLFQYMIPDNLAEVKMSFLQAYRKGKLQDPVFSYRAVLFDPEQVLIGLRKLENQFIAHSNPLVSFYFRLIHEDSECVRILSDRGTSEYQEWLSSLFGFPTYDEVKEAQCILEQMPSGSENVDVSTISCLGPDAMKQEVEGVLDALGIKGWEVMIENSSARISVNPVLQRIILKEDASFQPNEKNRLVAHEIGVHVTRSENGAKQPYIIFVKGFPDYLMTEEGLALLGEKTTGLLSHESLRKYCCRLIVAGACRECGFVECFEKIRGFLPDADCFDICARAKRGLTDTSSRGGFTKDQIYLKGFWRVEKLGKIQIADLFIGKIGVDDLPVLGELKLQRDVRCPEWVTQLKK